MDLNTYQQAALRTAKMFPTRFENMNHAALGMITEVGEFATEVKRMTIYGKPLDGERKAHMIEELGDFCWYIALGAHAIGMTLQGAFDADKTPSLPPNGDETLSDITNTLSMMIGGFSTIVVCERTNVPWPLTDTAKMFSALVQVVGVLAERLGTTREFIFEANIAKLRQRFPEKYSDEAAEARADKGGADARSS